MEIEINKSKKAELFYFLKDLSFNFNGTYKEEKEKVEIFFDLNHRFFKGVIFCEFYIKEYNDSLKITVQTKKSNIYLNNAGRGLLFLGFLSIIPWVFWWYFPFLFPLVSISGIFLILTYLGIGRKPVYINPNYYIEILNSHFKK